MIAATLKRIWNDRFKRYLFYAIVFLPILSYATSLRYYLVGATVIRPEEATFMTSGMVGDNSIFNFIRAYLPLFLLLIIGEVYIEDRKTGYKNILVTKYGQKAYTGTALFLGFSIPFLMMLFLLLYNLGMCFVLYQGGTASMLSADIIENIPRLAWANQHRLLELLTFMLSTSLLSGFSGLGCVALAMLLPNRFLAYPISYLLWLIPRCFPHAALSYAMQPFTEFGIEDALSAVFFVVGVNLLLAVSLCVKEHFDPFNISLKRKKGETEVV